MSCPCGSGLPLLACCGPLLDGVAAAPTAEALMRSRYTAHVLARIDYLLDTHDPSTRAGVDRAAVERWARESTWLGLTIVARERGGAGDDDGVVEFQAAHRVGGARVVHHERSRFARRQGRWTYVDGDVVKPAAVRRAATPGRNDPCPCGSGKKYKRCCGG
ncbi:MAG TPA: YchJ family protein [Polyangia bacterium]